MSYEAAFITVNRYYFLAYRLNERSDGSTHTTHAAHDEVAFHGINIFLHAVPPVLAADAAFDNAFNDCGCSIEHGSGAGKNQHRGKYFPSVAGFTDGYFTKPNGGDSGDGLVNRINGAEPQQDIAR